MEFREFASTFVPRNGIPSWFHFQWRVRKEFPRVCFYFCSTERNSELFSLPLKCSEGNSESLLLVCSTERNSELFSLMRKGSERKSKGFLFRGTAGIPSEITIGSVYFVFRGINFLSEIPNPNPDPQHCLITYRIRPDPDSTWTFLWSLIIIWCQSGR